MKKFVEAFVVFAAEDPWAASVFGITLFVVGATWVYLVLLVARWIGYP